MTAYNPLSVKDVLAFVNVLKLASSQLDFYLHLERIQNPIPTTEIFFTAFKKMCNIVIISIALAILKLLNVKNFNLFLF